MASRGGGIGKAIRDMLGGGQGHQGQQGQQGQQGHRPGQSQQPTAQSQRGGGGAPSSSGPTPTVRPGAPTGTTPVGAPSTGGNSAAGTPSGSTPYDYGDLDDQSRYEGRQSGTSQQPGVYESSTSSDYDREGGAPQGTMTPDTTTRGTTTPGTMAADTPTRGTTTPAPTAYGTQGTPGATTPQGTMTPDTPTRGTTTPGTMAAETTTPGMGPTGASSQQQQGWSGSTTAGTGTGFGGSATTSGPGLEPLLNRFRSNGLGDHVNSWLSDGPNKSLNPQQVRQGLGDQEIADLARHAGVSQDEVTSGLAKGLPQVVDRMTPHGRIPDESQVPDQIDRILGHHRH